MEGLVEPDKEDSMGPMNKYVPKQFDIDKLLTMPENKKRNLNQIND